MKNAMLVSLLTASLAEAGTTWTWSASSGDGATQRVVVQCQDDSVRVELFNRVVLWDGKKQVMQVFKKRSRRVMEQTRNELQAAATKRRESHFADLARYAPKEKRTALQADRLAAERNEWKLTPLGEKRDIGTYRCDLYRGTLDGDDVVFCLVPWKSMPGLDCMRSFWEAIELNDPVGPEMAIFGSLRTWPAFPVRSEYDTSEGKTVVSLDSVVTE